MAEGKWGWIDVTSMKLADGTDLEPRLRFEHPDDDNDQDQTVARVVHRGRHSAGVRGHRAAPRPQARRGAALRRGDHAAHARGPPGPARAPRGGDQDRVASEVSGRALSKFFRQTVLEGHLLDYEVASVSSQPARDPRGVFDRDGNRATVEAGDLPKKGGPPPAYETRVLVRRRGEVTLPVEVAFQFEGRPLERVAWDGREPWSRFTFVRPQRLLWARVDPDRRSVRWPR